MHQFFSLTRLVTSLQPCQLLGCIDAADLVNICRRVRQDRRTALDREADGIGEVVFTLVIFVTNSLQQPA